MGRKYQVISGDGHLETPPDFVQFVPEKYKDRAPKLITLPDGGGDAWLMEGMPLTYASQNLKGRGMVKFAGQSYFNDDGSRADGAGDGVAAAAGAGRRRHRRRAPLRARVRQPVPREDPRPRRVPGDGPGVQHVARRGLLRARARPAHRQRARCRSAASTTRSAELERAHAIGLQDRCSSSTTRTAAAARSPRTTASGRRRSSSSMALSPHMSFGGAINIGGPRHDTSQWPAEAGMTQHAQGPPAPTRWRS